MDLVVGYDAQTSVGCLLHGDAGDLHVRVFREATHLDSFPGRRGLLKEGAVYLIHYWEIVHVLQEYLGLNHMGEVHARGCQHGLEISHHLLRFFLYVGGDHRPG